MDYFLLALYSYIKFHKPGLDAFQMIEGSKFFGWWDRQTDEWRLKLLSPPVSTGRVLNVFAPFFVGTYFSSNDEMYGVT